MRMLRTTPLLWLLSASLLAQTPPAEGDKGAKTPPVVSPALDLIEKKSLLTWATWLADDARGGRLTGSAGQEEAAQYIAAHFEKLGLEPLGDEKDGKRGFFQRYGITRTFVTDKTSLTVGDLVLKNGFAVLGGRPVDITLDGKVRFCGLGRTKGDKADVPEDESLDGKVAVCVVKPLRGKVDKNLSVEQKMGMSLGTFGQLGRTTKAVEKKGAKAVLFVLAEDPMGLSDVLNYFALAPGKDSMSPRFEGADGSMAFASGMLGGGGEGIPSLVLSVPASDKLLAVLGVEREALMKAIAGEGEMPTGKADVTSSVALQVQQDDQATACNVVAVLRGSDPKLASEAVVFSAHMDHVGVRMDGDVFNGADDNASGSAGLMGIAAAFVRSKEKPRRSVIFLSVSGEELGLWGSAYYAENPTWAADKLIANVNTDMIGRSGPESAAKEVMITPSHRHAKFSTIVQDSARFAEELGLSLTSGDKYYSRSDHFNFAKKGIPVVFFCNGEHEDYHQVTDTADKLDGDKMELLARLAFWTGWAVANADEAPRTLGKRESWR